MNINRHNYEMFFLLYVDKELSAGERISVEQFVHENPDLKRELTLLMQTTLPVHEVEMDSKPALYRNEEAVLLKEKLLLYLDNELEQQNANELEALLKSDAAVCKEWELWQATKLDKAEKVVFEDKASLYHYSSNRVFMMRFARIAAAAAIIGFGIFFGIAVLTPDKPTNEVAAVKNKNSNGGPASENAVANNSSINNSSVNKDNRSAEPVIVNEITASVAKPAAKQPVQQAPNKKGIANNQLPETQIVKKETNNLPKPYFENINNQNSNQTTAQNVEQKNTGNLDKKILTNEVAVNQPKEKTSKPLTAPDVEILTTTNSSFAKTAALTDISEEQNNNRVFFLEEEKINRSKLSGFFRKVKRVIERKTNIKPGSGIKIAGFEIAAK